jgi:hypothetical protein
MFWLMRKLLIPVAAFSCGMWVQAGLSRDACTAAAGDWSRGVCTGVLR